MDLSTADAPLQQLPPLLFNEVHRNSPHTLTQLLHLSLNSLHMTQVHSQINESGVNPESTKINESGVYPEIPDKEP